MAHRESDLQIIVNKFAEASRIYGITSTCRICPTYRSSTWPSQPALKPWSWKVDIARLGHVIRMEDNKLPKQLVFGELASGKRKQGRPLKRSKDCVKASISHAEIIPKELEPRARDRTEGRAFIRHAIDTFEERRRTQIEKVRERRKASADAPGNLFPCPHCPRTCKSRIGLHSHLGAHGRREQHWRASSSILMDYYRTHTVESRTVVCGYFIQHTLTVDSGAVFYGYLIQHTYCWQWTVVYGYLIQYAYCWQWNCCLRLLCPVYQLLTVGLLMVTLSGIHLLLTVRLLFTVTLSSIHLLLTVRLLFTVTLSSIHLMLTLGLLFTVTLSSIHLLLTVRLLFTVILSSITYCWQCDCCLRLHYPAYTYCWQWDCCLRLHYPAYTYCWQCDCCLRLHYPA